MRKRILLAYSFILLFSQLTVGQKNRIYKWPSCNWTHAKAYVYNLENQILGDFQIIHNNKLNITATNPGIELNTSQITQLLNVVNGDTRVLNEGLAKCYEPHHGVVFYNEKNEIVGGFDVCFLCQGIKFYPAKKEKSPTAEYSNSSLKKAEAQLAAIKKTFVEGNLPVFDNSNEYRKLIPTKKSDTLTIINDSIFKDLLANYSSLKQLMAKNKSKISSLDSTTKFTFGEDKVTFYSLHSNEYNLNASSFNNGSLWITKLVVHDRYTSLFNKLKTGMRKVTFIDNYSYAIKQYFYENILVLYTSNKNEKLTIRFNPSNGIIQYIGYDFNH